ncbi:ATP-binding protein [Candidatus Poriferisocius sp.]|uniref:ATP-binding protein n=1 Tax=Candidatus Poriferisocius sp. TaxID=3101276 RepID=UPI003B524E0B
MIPRRLYAQLHGLLADYPAVALIGPRQVGKTTLALEIADTVDAVYLDLESPRDRARLSDPELYLADHQDRLVILDEVHRMPGLFQSLRGIIDRGRRRAKRSSQFLLLGSASMDLLRQSGETLAGRVAYLELGTFDVTEVEKRSHDKLWVRGGFPDSFLAADDGRSLTWRENFIRTYLERDVPQLGPRVPAETLRRLWVMLAHTQGGLLNAASLARGLGVNGKTVFRYLDLMVDLLLVRRLMPWRRNVGKRLVKSPKVYVRDSGVVHALLGLASKEDVVGHPVVGASWEGFVVETVLSLAPNRAEANFYRSSGGAEIDLILTLPGRKPWAIEVKRSLDPRPRRGFHNACEDVRPEAKFVVYPGDERYRLAKDIEAVTVLDIASEVAGSSKRP